VLMPIHLRNRFVPKIISLFSFTRIKSFSALQAGDVNFPATDKACQQAPSPFFSVDFGRSALRTSYATIRDARRGRRSKGAAGGIVKNEARSVAAWAFDAGRNGVTVVCFRRVGASNTEYPATFAAFS
jgi:hypothetical protein